MDCYLLLLLLHVLGVYPMVPTHRGREGEAPGFLKPLSDYTVRVGSDVTFTCQVANISIYKVAWLHSEKGIIAVFPDMVAQNDRMSSSYDNRDSWFLRIEDVRESDAGKYLCQLNTEPQSTSISGSLSVVVPPNIQDETSSADTLATEGNQVSLSCDALGTPKPTITWKREDGAKFRVCRGSTENTKNKCKEVGEFTGEILELTQISRFDSGVYLCIAKNGVPPTQSKKVRLYVDFPPTLWISHQLVGVELGQVATLECLTAAHPPSLNFWHNQEGEFINQKEGKFLTSTVEGSPSYYNILMKLTIINVTKENIGKYQCKAKNSLGETDGDISLYEITTTTTTPEYIIYDLLDNTTPHSHRQPEMGGYDENITYSDTNLTPKQREREKRKKMRERERRKKQRERNLYKQHRENANANPQSNGYFNTGSIGASCCPLSSFIGLIFLMLRTFVTL